MTITVNQIIRSKRKTLALIVKSDGSLIVRAPLRSSDELIREFVEKNRQWVEKKQAESAQSEATLAFEDWYREQARQILNERVSFYARQYDFQYKRIGITSARTRWGSCSATGSLNFSWRLIMAPLEVVDYVVVHELVHTVFLNHSRQFWHMIETIMPDYKEHRNWLKKNGSQLL